MQCPNPADSRIVFDSEKASSWVLCIYSVHKYYLISITFLRKEETLCAIESLVSVTFERPNNEELLSIPAVLCIAIHIPTSDNKICMVSKDSKGITYTKSTLVQVQHVHGTNGSRISQIQLCKSVLPQNTLGQDIKMHNDCNWALSNFCCVKNAY